MNRALATIIVLIFWANTAFGMPAACCCPTDGRELASCSGDNCVISRHDSSCNGEGACEQGCNDGCLSLRCPDELGAVVLPEFSTVFPQPQLLVSLTSATDSHEPLNTNRADSRSCPSSRPISVLLQTCSFLS